MPRDREEREVQVEYNVEKRVTSLIEQLENMHVTLKTNKTYFEMVSDTIRFADLFTYLYTLLPDYAREAINTRVGNQIPRYLSYKLTIVRGAGDKLVFQIRVGEKEGIDALNELIERCTKAFYALIEFIREYGYEFGVR